jgi:hypothetical protein
LIRINGQGLQGVICTAFALTRWSDHLGKMRLAETASVMTNLLRRPSVVSILMTPNAGVGDVNLR